MSALILATYVYIVWSCELRFGKFLLQGLELLKTHLCELWQIRTIQIQIGIFFGDLET